MALVVKNKPTNAGDVRKGGSILGQEDALEEGMAAHSSILAWRIPWTEEPGGLPSIGLQSQTELKQLSTRASERILKGVAVMSHLSPSFQTYLRRSSVSSSPGNV